MHTICFYLNLRAVPMHHTLILGIPFLQRFSPFINWQAQSFRVHRLDGVHWIPIVHRRPKYDAASVAVSHDLAPAASAGGIAFMEWEEPTEDDKRAVANIGTQHQTTQDLRRHQRPRPVKKRKYA